MAINFRSNTVIKNLRIGPLSGGGGNGGGSSSGWRTSEPTYLVVGGQYYDSNDGRSYQYDLATLTRTYIDTGRGGSSGVTVGNTYYVGSTSNDQVTVYDATAGAIPNTRQATINAPSGTDSFGQSLAASSDYLVVGAPGDDTLHGNSGAAFVYDASNLSATPTKLLPYGTFNSTDRLEFGTSVALNGNTIAVGSIGLNSTYNGSVMVYDASNLSANPTVLEVTSFDGTGGDYFGNSVAITTDYVIVGSPNSDQNGSTSGAVYLYSRSNLAASPTILTPGLNDKAGYAVAATDEYLVVGAPSEGTSGTRSGAAFIYDMSDLSASPTMIKASDPQQYAQFGESVDVQGSTIVVGAPEYRDQYPYGDEKVGAVYIFDANNLSTTGTKLVDTVGMTRYAEFGYSVALG